MPLVKPDAPELLVTMVHVAAAVLSSGDGAWSHWPTEKKLMLPSASTWSVVISVMLVPPILFPWRLVMDRAVTVMVTVWESTPLRDAWIMSVPGVTPAT